MTRPLDKLLMHLRMTSQMRSVTVLFCLMLIPISVSAQPTLTLKQIMDDPDWIGQPVDRAWWQLDGSSVIYEVERVGSDLTDTRRIDLASGQDSLVALSDRIGIDGPEPIFDAELTRALYSRDGNLFIRDLRTQETRQLTKDTSQNRQATFSSDGKHVYFVRGREWFGIELASGLQYPISDIRFSPDPDQASKDTLTQMQLRLFSSLANDERSAAAQRAERERAAMEDVTQSPAPWYVGSEMEPVNSVLSPNGRYLLQVVSPKQHARGREGQMPHYVTVDGYIETESVRTRVGRNDPSPQSLWLFDLQTKTLTKLSLEHLSAISEDPLADLKALNGVQALRDGELRAVGINAIQWHPTANIAAIQIRSRDNKDRWIVTLDPSEGKLVERHRLNDPAWINWRYNDMGWFGDAGEPRLWFLSEESGFSHLYMMDAFKGEPRALSTGTFEISSPQLSSNEQHFFVLANRMNSGRYDLYQLNLEMRDLIPLTTQGGIESFAILPTADQILIRYSSIYLPAQVGLVAKEGGDIQALTDTRTPQFQTMDWQMPQFVSIPGQHGQAPIAAKFYPARTPKPENGHPIVLFVHGAGYLQNVWHRYPNYFREQMFHNFLTERGYHVLDMDFRASAGYGRDWRTAIYRQMGTPELEDLIDGVRWVVDTHGGDPARAGLYGGSYGGFMTFMALFKAADVFKAGAALRPVSDWAHYNHPYTSNILNTPDVDPEAYRRSSPIEFAQGLEGHLLMTHGMLDDNVFYQDVVRLSQVLLDLEKDHWELASYPLERHGFQRPSSWRDQYWRIYHLFEETIGYQAPID
jgi:dipeptidyl aminopeptidase/acylaminoacyl peptidase